MEPVKPVGAAPEARTEPQPEQPQAAQPPGQPAEQPRSGEQPATGAMRIAEITADPDAHMRETVIVVGEVEDMLASRAFTLDDDAPGKAGQDSDLMVLGKDSASWRIDDPKGDTRWRVEGTLQRIPAANLSKQLGWKPDQRVQNEIDGETFVLIAERVERVAIPQEDERQDVRGEEPPVK